MRITWSPTRYDAAFNGFSVMSFYSGNSVNGGSLLFYCGDPSKLVTIYRNSAEDVQIRHFTGTCGNYDTLVREQFDDFIRPWLKTYPLYKGILYSLEYKRVLLYDDFTLQIPPRGKEIFFTHKKKDDVPGFDILWLDRRALYKLEDLAVLDAMCSWNSWGIQTPTEGQTPIGKKLMILLHETVRNSGFPAYLDLDRLTTMCNYIEFVHEDFSYESRIMEHLGTKYEESLKDICGVDIVDGHVDVDFLPIDKESFIPYLKEGKINLTELSDFKIPDVLSYLDEYERVEVHIDVVDMGIRRMVLFPQCVLIVRDNSRKERAFYEEMLGLSETNLVVSDSLDILEPKK